MDFGLLDLQGSGPRERDPEGRGARDGPRGPSGAPSLPAWPGLPQLAQFTPLEPAGPAAAPLRRVRAALKWLRGK